MWPQDRGAQKVSLYFAHWGCCLQQAWRPDLEQESWAETNLQEFGHWGYIGILKSDPNWEWCIMQEWTFRWNFKAFRCGLAPGCLFCFPFSFSILCLIIVQTLIGNYFWYLVKWNSYRSTSGVNLLSHLVHVSSGRMYNHTSCLILEVPGLIFMLSHGMLWEAAFPTVRSGNTLGTPNKWGFVRSGLCNIVSVFQVVSSHSQCGSRS